MDLRKHYIQYTEVGKLGSWTLAVSMGSNGVSEVGAGASERVGGMVNRTSLASGSIAWPGACGGGRPVGAETCVTIS